MATTYRNLFERTLMTSELAELHLSKDDPLGETVKKHMMTATEIKRARRFAARVLETEAEGWSRSTLNQLRYKGLTRSTKFPNARKFGFELDDYEKFLTRVIGNEAFIGTPRSTVFIRLYVVDDMFIIADSSDAEKLELFLKDWVAA